MFGFSFAFWFSIFFLCPAHVCTAQLFKRLIKTLIAAIKILFNRMQNQKNEAANSIGEWVWLAEEAGEKNHN